MNKVYRAHPLMVISRIKPFLFVLILPFVRGLLQYITDRTITSILGIELIIFAIIIAFSILNCLSFRLRIDGDTVSVRSGMLFVKRANIKISSLSSVQSEQNVLDTIFGAVTYSINTEAGRQNRSDFKFKLYLRDSREVSRLLYGEKSPKRVKFSALRVAILAATTSSAFSGIIIGVPVLKKSGDLLGLALYDMLFDEITNVSKKFTAIFPPIVNTLSLILLLCYGVSFGYSLLKYINFRLYLGEDKLEIRSGFFTRCRTSFRKSAVNSVKIEQTPFMSLVKRFAMKVSVGGYGDSKSESAVVMPCGTKTEIKDGFSAFFPFLIPKGTRIRPYGNLFTRSRFMLMPSILLISIIAISVPLAVIFKDFDRLIFFITIVALIADFYFAHISYCESKFGKLVLGETIYAHGVKKLRSTRLYCPKEKVGEIKIYRFLTDFPQKTCRVRVTVRSESADSICIRMLPVKEVKEEIYNCYGIRV